MSRRWPALGGRRDLSTRLLLAIVVVVIVGGASAFATRHAEEAFRTASALSLALALLAALLTSVAVSFFLTGRIARSLAP